MFLCHPFDGHIFSGPALPHDYGEFIGTNILYTHNYN